MTNCKGALGRPTRGVGVLITGTVILIVNSGVAAYTLIVAKSNTENINRVKQIDEKRKEFYDKTIEGFESVKNKISELGGRQADLEDKVDFLLKTAYSQFRLKIRVSSHLKPELGDQQLHERN